MELETIRCVVSGLTDGTIGVNAMIDGLTLEGGDARPDHVTVYDSVRHGWVARKTFALTNMNATLPGVAVFVTNVEVLTPEIETVVRDAHITVALAHLAEKSATEVGNYNALQTIRAILRFLRAFSANGNATMRTRNGIIVERIDEIVPQSVAAIKDDVFIGASVEVTFYVRETSP